jgi:undecaprenyl-diphosphatase
MKVLPVLLLIVFAVSTWIFISAAGPSDLDIAVLRWAGAYRSTPLTDAFVWLTLLGVTPAALVFSLVAWRRNRVHGMHLAAAVIGAWAAGQLIKLIFERARPDVIPQLVASHGFSYPSGHALTAAATYTTVAILICRELPRSRRVLVIAAAATTIALVALSRVYLGVHYLSDTIGGVSLGTAWAFLLSRFFQNVKESAAPLTSLDNNGVTRRE